MGDKNKISNEQIKALIVTIVVGVGVLSLPSDMAVRMNNDGWLGILIGGLITIPFIILIDKLFKLYPNKNLFEIGRDTMPNILFKLFMTIFLIYNIVLLSYVIRIFADTIKTYLLETTPTEVIVFSILLATSYIARSQLEVIARMAVMIYPIIIGFIIFLIIISIPSADFSNILPIFRVDYKAIIRGVLMSIFAYSGYEFILLVLPLAENPDKTLRYSLNGMFIIIGIYLLSFFISLSQYGIHQLKRQIWPTIALVKEVDLPGYFLQNLDGIVMALWVMVVYGTIGPALHFSGVILSDILNTKNHELYILPLIPVIYIISLLPKSLVETDETLGILLRPLSIIAIMIIPTILYILAKVKKKGEES